MKAEVDKLNINKLVNELTSLNSLKTKADDLGVGKLKTVPVVLNKLSYVIGNEFVKSAKYSTLKTKVNNLEKKIPYATTLIHINQSEVGNKIPNTSSLMTIDVLRTKISEVENRIPDHTKYITIPEFPKLAAENFTAKLKQADLVS